MKRYSWRLLAIIALISSLWFASAAQASSCLVNPPSRYIPVLRLAEPVTHAAFDIRENAGALEIRNLSPDALLLVTIWSETPSTRIAPATTFNLDLDKADIYVEKTPFADSCNGVVGVLDGQPVPPAISTQFALRLGREVVNVPMNFVYEVNPHYARDLRSYEDHQELSRNRAMGLAILGIFYLVGYGIVLIAAAIGAIFLLRWLKGRADERWE
ncbi:MAG TPA: hypothetical protein VD886_02795 [Herpetosiphonaceae bacterium]|nr:hypothetical protein [Herpetosiphonaceae bacterium]